MKFIGGRMSVKQAIAAFGLALSLSAPVLAAETAAHSATYKVIASDLNETSNLRGIFGTLTTSQENTCAAWVGEQDFKVAYFTLEGGEIHQRTKFSFFESVDGTHYRFSMIDSGPDQVTELAGEARLRGPGQDGAVMFSKPEPVKFTLSEGTQFPVAFTAWLVEQAEAGERMVSTPLFDGNELRADHKATAFIGPKMSAQEWRKMIPDAPQNTVTNRPGWLFSLAYFTSDSMQPFLEIKVVLLENGVAPKWALDYGDFTLNLLMQETAEIAAPNC